MPAAIYTRWQTIVIYTKSTYVTTVIYTSYIHSWQLPYAQDVHRWQPQSTQDIHRCQLPYTKDYTDDSCHLNKITVRPLPSIQNAFRWWMQTQVNAALYTRPQLMLIKCYGFSIECQRHCQTSDAGWQPDSVLYIQAVKMYIYIPHHFWLLPGTYVTTLNYIPKMIRWGLNIIIK